MVVIWSNVHLIIQYNFYLMKKTIDFTEKVIETVKFIKDQEGHKTFTATLHNIISQYYLKFYFTKYGGAGSIKKTVVEPLKPDMTPGQICEFVGGTVGKNDAMKPACILKGVSVMMAIPFDKVGYSVEYLLVQKERIGME